MVQAEYYKALDRVCGLIHHKKQNLVEEVDMESELLWLVKFGYEHGFPPPGEASEYMSLYTSCFADGDWDVEPNPSPFVKWALKTYTLLWQCQDVIPRLAESLGSLSQNADIREILKELEVVEEVDISHLVCALQKERKTVMQNLRKLEKAGIVLKHRGSNGRNLYMLSIRYRFALGKTGRNGND